MTVSTPCLLQAPPPAASRARRWHWREAIGGVIINADSMQVYREAPILTAQPSIEDMARVPHLLYGHVSAREALFGGPLSGRCGQALADVRGMARCPDLRRRHRALFRGADRRPGRHSRHPRRRARSGARAAGRDRRRGACMPNWLRAIPKRRRGCDPPIRSACCAPMKCSRRRAGRWRTGRSTHGNAACSKACGSPTSSSSCRAPTLRERIDDAFRGHAGRRARWRRRGARRISIPRLPAAKLLGLRPLRALACRRAGTRRRRSGWPSPPRGNLPSAR